ncbi:MAG: peptidylprolyl isomerase [Bacteroidetes bacterium]|nr:peptidylprolyl isomerase [Bacteroidota bacterium]
MNKSIILYVFIGLFMSYSCSDAQSKKYKNQIVLISTEFGDMKIRLYDETPKHKENFLKLVDEGFYDGLLFHRVINEFMLQGGDPNSKGAEAGAALGNGGPGYTIPAEFNPELNHKKGALAAARQGDQVNPKKESSGSQFYIVHGKRWKTDELETMSKRSGIEYTEEQMQTYREIGGTPHLDGSYTVFGEVFEGLEVIDKIAAAKADSRNRPLEDIQMTITLIKK